MAEDLRIDEDKIPPLIKDNLEKVVNAFFSNFPGTIITNKFYIKNESKEGYDLYVRGYFELNGQKYNVEFSLDFNIN